MDEWMKEKTIEDQKVTANGLQLNMKIYQVAYNIMKDKKFNIKLSNQSTYCQCDRNSQGQTNNTRDHNQKQRVNLCPLKAPREAL